MGDCYRVTATACLTVDELHAVQGTSTHCGSCILPFLDVVILLAQKALLVDWL